MKMKITPFVVKRIPKSFNFNLKRKNIVINFEVSCFGDARSRTIPRPKPVHTSVEAPTFKKNKQ